MTDVGLLGFARDALRISYRASDRPQPLVVTLTTEALPAYGLAPENAVHIAHAINHGAAGGAHFAPSAGAAALTGGELPRRGEESPRKTSYRFEYEVAGVCPAFMRFVVERLRTSGAPGLVTSMEIVGGLPTDGSELSVTEAHVRAALGDPMAHPRAWPAPFRVEERRVARGASIRARCHARVDAAAEEAFALQMATFGNVVADYLDAEGAGPGDATSTPEVHRGSRELSARWEECDVVRGPARDVLVNLLVWFHDRVLPLDEVVLCL